MAVVHIGNKSLVKPGFKPCNKYTIIAGSKIMIYVN